MAGREGPLFQGRFQTVVAEPVAYGVELAVVVARVEQLKGETWAEFRDRQGDWGRDAVLWLGRQCGGKKLGELAQLVEVGTAAAVALAVKRFAARLATDAKLRRDLMKIREDLLNGKTCGNMTLRSAGNSHSLLRR